MAADPGDPKSAPSVVRHEHIGLGIAVDHERPDGSRTLLVPVIKDAGALDFRGFWSAYEELIRKVRTNKIGADDLAGRPSPSPIPGTLGTVQSVPRLMPGQGVIVGVGAIDYPAEWQAADPRVLAELGVSKVVTITSTYDHRIIQGAESGLFLQRVHQLLIGEDSFYERVFKAMGVPYEPVRHHRDVNDIADGSSVHAQKQIEVDNLINLYRVRGHLIAHLDPLDWSEPHMHPELDPATHGLSVWDLDREFLTNGLAGSGAACGSATSSACCGTPTAGRSASSTCTSRSPARSAGSRSTSRGVHPAQRRTSTGGSSTGSTPPRRWSSSSTPSTSARSASGWKAARRPSR